MSSLAAGNWHHINHRANQNMHTINVCNMFKRCIYFLIEYMYIYIYLYTYIYIYIIYIKAHSYPIQDLPTTWVSQDEGIFHFTVALV